MRRFSFPLSFLIVMLFSCTQEDGDDSVFTFRDVPAELSGVEFVNKLKISEDLNAYTYRNFYNGAGVAIGDINGDGLADIYFAGNQVDNKLYLNRGNFEFEDITEPAGVACKDVWSTGVNFVDVNGDGLLDIYVCKSGPPGGTNRRNELFINNGDLTFREEAAKWGIDDLGLSQHSAFFDYDKDGDLDMYLLNNSMRSVGLYDLKEGRRDERDPFGGNKLYRNDGDHFTDVSEEANIYGSAIGYGLGVTISDLNGDGWQDIFVSNDFFERDYCYLNNQDGTFSEVLTEMMPEISMGSMGADIADLDNDARPEIYVTEMLPEKWSRLKSKTLFEKWDKHQANIKAGYHYQYTRNVLQWNRGNDPYSGMPLFSDIARQKKVHATDWSWGAILADFDNDSYKDIFVANGIAKDLTDHDYMNFYANNSMEMAKYREDSTLMTRLIDQIPSTPVSNYFFRNSEGLEFDNITKDVGLHYPGFSNGSAYGDLDNDGDLDLVVSNIDAQAKIYENKLRTKNYLRVKLTGRDKNTSAIGTQLTIYTSGKRQYYEHNPVKGYMSSMDHTLVVGLGEVEEVDSIKVLWPDLTVNWLRQIRANQTIKLTQTQGGKKPEREPAVNSRLFEKEDLYSSIRHQESNFIDFNRDRLLFHMRSNEGPKIAVDKTSSLVFMPGAKGSASVLYRLSKGRVIDEQELEESIDSEDIGGLFFDYDGDGDDDLYVSAGGIEQSAFSTHYIDRLYANEDGEFVLIKEILPAIRESSSDTEAVDYDGDGDLDVLVSVRAQPFVFGEPKGIILLENTGSKFEQVQDERVVALQSVGMLTDMEVADINQDGWQDLVVVGDWMPAQFFINDRGTYRNATRELITDNLSGFWNAVGKGDVNEDGIPDFILANSGTNSRLLASAEEPLTMFINDFDQNGTVDPILCVYEDGQLTPAVMLDDLLKQLPILKKSNIKFAEYSRRSIDELFPVDQLEKAVKLEITTLGHTLLLSTPDGSYKATELNWQSQISSVSAIALTDANDDGHLDILLAGNQSKVKPELGAYRSGYGTLLLGDGKGNFEHMNPEESGLVLRGDARSFAWKQNADQKVLLVGYNDGPIEVFKLTRDE